jgi:hypothetical protein
MGETTTAQIMGSYRGNPAIFYVDPSTGRAVITSAQNVLITAFRLGAGQLENALAGGNVY